MSKWVKARVFATGLEADMARARLESADIPTTLRAHGASGIFGPGFQGVVPGGVELHVPDNRLSEVKDVLDDDLDPLPNAIREFPRKRADEDNAT